MLCEKQATTPYPEVVNEITGSTGSLRTVVYDREFNYKFII